MTGMELFQLYSQLTAAETELFDREWMNSHENEDQKELDKLSNLSYKITVAQQAIDFNESNDNEYFTTDWIIKNVLKFDK